jgi:hypothetical protein
MTRDDARWRAISAMPRFHQWPQRKSVVKLLNFPDPCYPVFIRGKVFLKSALIYANLRQALLFR